MVERKRTADDVPHLLETPRVRIRVRPDNAALVPSGEQTDPARRADSSNKEIEIRGVYVISVAARLLEMHPQTLRKYERLGLIRPARTMGMLRLYSEEDLQRLRLIRYLEEALGLNLAGVVWALNLVNQLMDMRQRLSMVEETERLHQELNSLLQALNLPFEDVPPAPGRTGDAGRG